jgi:hypothetical protein
MKDPVQERIEREIGEHDVVLFMKGTPVFPQCGFSSLVVQVLSHLGVKFKGIDVLSDPALRHGIKAFSIGRQSRSFMSKANLSAAAILSARCVSRANSPNCLPRAREDGCRPDLIGGDALDEERARASRYHRKFES